MLIRALLSRIFVDSAIWHRFWHCHRRPERSFSVSGRQFHICARCTGLVAGMVAAPIAAVCVAPTFVGLGIATAVLAVDGLTQFAGWRQSTNMIRFLTGATATAMLGPGLMRLIHIV